MSDATTGDSEIEWAKNGAITDGGFEMWLHECVRRWVVKDASSFRRAQSFAAGRGAALLAGVFVVPVNPIQCGQEQHTTSSDADTAVAMRSHNQRPTSLLLSLPPPPPPLMRPRAVATLATAART